MECSAEQSRADEEMETFEYGRGRREKSEARRGERGREGRFFEQTIRRRDVQGEDPLSIVEIGAIGSGAADGGADRPFYRPTLRLAAIHSVKGKKESRVEERRPLRPMERRS